MSQHNNDMKKRIISAIIMVLVLGTCVFISEISRVLIFAACGILCAYEYCQRLKENNINCFSLIMYIYLVIICILTITNCGLMTYIAWTIFAIYFSLFFGILKSSLNKEGTLYTVLGLSYPCLPFAIVMIICSSERWLETLLLSCIASWTCDIFALFGGMLFGKTKIAPNVSPSKTIEGSICGALMSTLSGILVFFLLKQRIPAYVCLITAFFSSTMGQIGDLSESLLKRYIGIKDFSNLIPGHGGMFDRADALMFAIPTGYFFLYILGY